MDVTGEVVRGAILLVQFSAQRDGSAMSGLMLMEGLARAGTVVDVIFGSDGPLLPMYARLARNVDVLAHKNCLRGGGLLRTMHRIVGEHRNGASMAARIASCRPDLVYVNSAASYAGALAARRVGIPCVWHLRELFSDEGGELHCPSILRGWARREVLRLPTRLVANSKAVASNLVGERPRIEVIPNAVEDRFFLGDLLAVRVRARSALRLPSDAVVIGVPGTLRPMKGHRFCLEALAPLLEERPQALLVISGETNHEFGRTIMALAQSLPGSAQISFLGEQRDMIPFYAACDVVCVPSSSEPFGRTVIEAMAVGVPVVATRVGGIPEIIESGETGLLVPFGDKGLLLAAIRGLLDDSEARSRLARAGRAMAEREFRREIYQERILRVVLDVMAAQARSAYSVD